MINSNIAFSLWEGYTFFCSYWFLTAFVVKYEKHFEKEYYMGVVVGIDIGGSTTKIVGFDEKKNLIHYMDV